MKENNGTVNALHANAAAAPLGAPAWIGDQLWTAFVRASKHASADSADLSKPNADADVEAPHPRPCGRASCACCYFGEGAMLRRWLNKSNTSVT